MSRAAAFFDLDRTLISVNSGYVYARYERSMGRISRIQLAQAFLWMSLYHLNRIDMMRAYEQALSHYRGRPEAEVMGWTRELFELDVRHRLQPGATRVMEVHRRRGEPLVLLSNTSPYLAELATIGFGLDEWIANRFLVDDGGRLTGEIERPLCYGVGKVERARRWAETRNISIASSTFYTDSASDIPMLEEVGTPRIVNPDPKLRRTAKQRGWRVEDWST